MPLTISDTDIAKFTGVLEWELMESGLSREAIADGVGFHVSQLSQIKSNPDPIRVARVFKKLGRLEYERELRMATR